MEAVNKLAVDLVGNHEQVVVLRKVANEANVLLGEHAASRVLGRVDDQHSCLRGDKRPELIEVHAKSGLLTQRDDLRNAADEVHLRGVCRVAGVWKDHLVPRLDAGKQSEKQDVL